MTVRRARRQTSPGAADARAIHQDRRHSLEILARGRRAPLLAATLSLTFAVPGARAQRTPADTTPACPAVIAEAQRTGAEFGLVLSGGGARGMAHIGLLRVLDSIGVRPSLVVGTSMGALVGSLYAGGLSARRIDSIARSLPLTSLFRRYEPNTIVTAGNFTSPLTVLPPTFVVELHAGRMRLQSPVAREPRINALFNQLLLRANLTAAGDFDRLPIPFRAVATDMRARKAVVLGDLDLAEAVRASIAIPVIFAPVDRLGVRLVDGGLSSNVPIAVARSRGATRLVVADVGGSVADSSDAVETRSMLAYLVDELFSQPLDSLGPDDLLVRPPVARFNPLEFTEVAVGRLIDVGYATAVRALRGCAVVAPPPRIPSSSPRLALEPELAERLSRLAEQETFESVWLRPRLTAVPSGDSTVTELRFSPVAEPMPESVFSAGLTYEAQEGARVWLAARNIASVGGRASLASALSLGEWRQSLIVTATEGSRARLPLPPADRDSARGARDQVSLPDPRSHEPPWSTLARDLLRPEFTLTLSREMVRLYDDRGREGGRPLARDIVVFAGAGAPPASGRRLALGAVAHVWWTHSAALAEPDEASAFGAMLRAAWSFAPIGEGPEPAMEPTIAAEALWLDAYHRALLDADVGFSFGKLIVRPRIAAGWGERLPLGAQFTLGGPQGFPGLRVGERRAERFAFGSLAVLRRIVGPLYGRVEVGAGTTSLTRTRRAEVLDGAASGWVRGAEAGIATDTPLGTLSLGAGISSDDRMVFKIRIGS